MVDNARLVSEIGPLLAFECTRQCCDCLQFPYLTIDNSYDEALQALAESEAKRETAERELKIVRQCFKYLCVLTNETRPPFLSLSLSLSLFRHMIKCPLCGKS